MNEIGKGEIDQESEQPVEQDISVEESAEIILDSEPEIEVSVEAHQLAAAERQTMKKLFSALKMYRNKELSLFQIKGKSEAVSDMVNEIKHVLEAGGAPATADSLIEAVVDEAMNSKTDDDFIDHVLDPTKLRAGSELHKFYAAYAAGLEKQALQEAA